MTPPFQPQTTTSRRTVRKLGARHQPQVGLPTGASHSPEPSTCGRPPEGQNEPGLRNLHQPAATVRPLHPAACRNSASGGKLLRGGATALGTPRHQYTLAPAPACFSSSASPPPLFPQHGPSAAAGAGSLSLQATSQWPRRSVFCCARINWTATGAPGIRNFFFDVLSLRFNGSDGGCL